jgi:hypothetical protein
MRFDYLVVQQALAPWFPQGWFSASALLGSFGFAVLTWLLRRAAETAADHWLGRLGAALRNRLRRRAELPASRPRRRVKRRKRGRSSIEEPLLPYDDEDHS